MRWSCTEVVKKDFEALHVGKGDFLKQRESSAKVSFRICRRERRREQTIALQSKASKSKKPYRTESALSRLRVTLLIRVIWKKRSDAR